MILRFLVYAFLLYLAYKLVFDLIIPVYRTTRRVKNSFREMQERMNSRAGNREEPPPTPDASRNEKVGEYIDFEDIR